MNPGRPDITLHPPGTRAEASGQHTEGKRKQGLIWGLAALLIILALVVLIVLPARVQQTKVQQGGGQQPAVQQPAVQQPDLPQMIPTADVIQARPPTPAPVETPVVAQQDAQLALQSFLRQRAQADLEGAQIWAEQVWTKSLNEAQQGDKLYGQRRFNEAQLAYQDATRGLAELQAARSQILIDTLASAQTSLQNNVIGQAIAAFERVLAMQADHSVAQLGLAQAGVREQVLAQMEAGRKAESMHNYSAAADAYRSGLLLDPAYTAASTALQSVTEILARQAYQKAISQALAELKSGNLKAAEMAINAASKINADTPEIRDARQRLREARLQSSLNRLRQQAQTHDTQENWTESAGLYAEALKLDPRASFARSGLDRAEARLQLHKQLDHYLQAPQRLSSNEPRNNATLLLEANPLPPEHEPLLVAKISALREAVRLASLPATLLIKSDGLTEISIYHVGRLGTFEQKQIELNPGAYTVTGSRTGYRDVRTIIQLSPDTPATLTLRCEERI